VASGNEIKRSSGVRDKQLRWIQSIITGFCCVVLLSGIGRDAYGQQTTDDYYNQGVLLYQQGKYAEAEKKFQEALTATKTERERYYQRGTVLYKQGKYKEAQEEFARALALKEQESDQHYKQGLLLYQQGKYTQAQQEFKKAIAVVPEKEAASAVSASGAAASSSPATEYRISNGDLLLVKVWQNQDLDTEAIVRPDGMVSLPLVGDVVATGETIPAFRKTLTEKFREYIKEPQVSVSMKTVAGRRVVILGQVRSPGVYSVSGRNTIMEAIGMAGGFTEDAVTSSVMLVRGGLAKPVPKRLDLAKALTKADVSDNVMLESDDMVYVPRRFVKDVNYFLRMFLDPVTQGFFIRKELPEYCAAYDTVIRRAMEET